MPPVPSVTGPVGWIEPYSSVTLKLTLLASTPDVASVMEPEMETITISPFGGQSVAG